MFSNILDILVNNAFVLFISVFPDWNAAKHYRRRLFIETLAKSLIKGYTDRRQQLPRFINCGSKVSMATSANKLKRGRCCYCGKSDNKHTLNRCFVNISFHLDPSVTYF